MRRELGRDVRIGYAATGAPQLPDGQAHISVSHCPGRVAVLLAGGRCAVDIEPATRNFERAAPRYLTPDERMLSADPAWLAVAWCAKEALYKYAGRPGLDLLRDLRLEGVERCTDGCGAAAGGRIGELAEGRAGGFFETCFGVRAGECFAGCSGPFSEECAGAYFPGRIAGRIAGGERTELVATVADGYVVVTIV